MNLFEICQEKMIEKVLSEDKRYKKRLKWELEEIAAKDKENYFLDLYERKVRYINNQNNLLICWLLNIAPNFSIDLEPNCIYGEYGDCDVDYITVVRNYLKETWAPKTFGVDYVCNIGNYTTFGLKSSLIDMARVHGESRDEIQAITKNIDIKDDEGKTLTWDAAMRLYPDLKKYCEDHKEVAESAKKLLNRNRGTGIHAGGLIIANSPLSDLVPLIKRKDAPQASAWVEGLHGQDLQPVGLVKFDLLVIANLLQIARCCEMVKQRHGIDGICAKPNMPDWSDVEAWRSDSAALAMANDADLKGIFQFDSEGIRKLVRSGGVDRFEDLVAYSALYRPGPMGLLMHTRYFERKRGREKFVLHLILQPILGKTYGVIIFQEQVMKMLNVVGDIPLKDCEILRKAISKKKVEKFIKYKEMFIINGQKNLGCSIEEVNFLWDQIEAFSEYGFCQGHAVAYSYLSMYGLYLKAHYPHEFVASVLSCETLSEKIKEYKMEAKFHGVQVLKLDINKSGVNFELQGDEIYFGMSNIKGIGEAPAKRIVEGQPYKSFEDFLHRFGTDASVLKPLLGLRCFRDRDPVTLWKFSEHFKDCLKKIDDKKKRYLASIIRYEEQFKELLPNETRLLSDFDETENPFDTDEYKLALDKNEFKEVNREVECNENEIGAASRHVITTELVDDIEIEREVIKYFNTKKVKKTWNRWKALKSMWQKRIVTIQKHKNMIVGSLPSLASFNAHAWEIPEEFAKELSDPIVCEEKYYGFSWVHELERSPNYRGNLTFDNLRNNPEVVSGAVELKIIKSSKIESKKGNIYYQLIADDVTGQENKINIWQDDWDWWGKTFVKDTLLRLKLQPPSNGFNTFTLEANQIGHRRGSKRYNSKDDDIRVIPYKNGEREEEKFLTDDEALAQFSNCTMEL